MTVYPITSAASPRDSRRVTNAGVPTRVGLALCFYFLECAARSAPAVMIKELSLAFGTAAVGGSVILGTYYYSYSITRLVAGAALDRE